MSTAQIACQVLLASYMPTVYHPTTRAWESVIVLKRTDQDEVRKFNGGASGGSGFNFPSVRWSPVSMGGGLTRDVFRIPTLPGIPGLAQQQTDRRDLLGDTGQANQPREPIRLLIQENPTVSTKAKVPNYVDQGGGLFTVGNIKNLSISGRDQILKEIGMGIPQPKKIVSQEAKVPTFGENLGDLAVDYLRDRFMPTTIQPYPLPMGPGGGGGTLPVEQSQGEFIGAQHCPTDGRRKATSAFIDGCGKLIILDQFGCPLRKRRRRKRLATASDIGDLAGLKSVLSAAQVNTWIATRGRR